MRCDDARQGQDNKKSKQADGKADTESEGLQSSIRLAFVLNHVEQGGAEAHDDSEEDEQYDDLDPHSITSVYIRLYEYTSRQNR